MLFWEHWHLVAGKWAAFMGIRILESALVLLLVGLIWAVFRKRLSAQTVYWLFLLVLFKLVVPGPVTIKGGAWGELSKKIKIISSSPQHIRAESKATALESIECSPVSDQTSALKPASETRGITRSSFPSILTILMLLWMIPVFLMLAKFAVNQHRLRRLIRRSYTVETGHWPFSFNKLKTVAGIRRPVSTISSEELASPAVLGIFRPILVIPRDLFTRYPCEQIKWIMFHEMAHVRRFDNLVFLFQKLIQMLFFLYPGVWIANRMIDRQREYACDDAALAASQSPRRECGRAFLNLVTDSQRAPLLHFGTCSGIHSCKQKIRRRLMRILDGSRQIKTRLSRSGLAFILGAGILFGLFSVGNDTPGFSSAPEKGEPLINRISKNQEPLESRVIPLPGLADGAVKLEMVLIKAGSFMMGSPEAEPGEKNTSWPAHQVTITRDYYMGKFEITQAQWEAVAGKHRSYFRDRPNHPVEKVSWRTVRKFLRNINALGMGTFRLPTEAEWEYACRAGTQTRFFFGDSLDQANSYMWWEADNQPRGTKEVGLKLPNPWGLYDMHGNVSEWCSDYWGRVSTQGNRIDPQGPEKGSSLIPFLQKRVFRGGGYFYPAGECRSDYRHTEQEMDYHSSVGFRLVLEIPKTLEPPQT